MVTYPQSAAVPMFCGQAFGTVIACVRSMLPASRSSTRAAGSSVSLAASTQPAEPAPTTMKSYSDTSILAGRGLHGCHGVGYSAYIVTEKYAAYISDLRGL